LINSTIRFAYDALNRPAGTTQAFGGGTYTLRYTYDAVGNRISREDRDGVTTYSYDFANRLVSADDPAAAETFAYDENGNRLADKRANDYAYDAANRIQANSLYTFAHDPNGNLTGRTNKSGNATITYAYNPEQQLSEVTTPDHSVSYKYDPLGRRIEKTVDGNIQRYVYDNEDIIAILDSTNRPTETFTHGPGIDEPLIMTKADGASYFYHADGLGSITALTNDKKEIVETYTYKAYGEPTIKDRTGAILLKSAVGNPYLFTSRELDSESGLYYYRARYYDWRRGAFTQEDPLGLAGSDTNFYAYVKNGPTRAIDPTGKLGWIIAGGIISGGIDFGIQYAQTGSLSKINWVSVGLSAGSGALGVGVGNQITKIGATALNRVILNAGAAGSIGGYSQMAKNISANQPLSDNLAEATLVSSGFAALGSSIEELAQFGVSHVREMTNKLSLQDELLLRSNAVTHYGQPHDHIRSVITAGGLGISSSGDLYTCE